MLESLKKSPIKLALIILALVLVNVVGWFLYFNWDTPFGEPLDLSTPTLEETVQNETTPTATENPATDTPSSPTETLEPGVTPTKEPVCGAPPSMLILLAGVDSNSYLYGLADSIRVVRLDFVNEKVTVAAFPRDLWVDIPGTAKYGVSEGRLNQAYFYGTEGMGMWDGTGYGAGLLANTLQVNYGLEVDHYLVVNLRGFRNIIDALGGLEVYLPEDVYIKHFGQPKLYLNAGPQILTGKQAENVVRTRIEIGDFGRIRNQTMVLRALAVKMLTPSGIQQIPDLANQLLSYVLTDFSASDISKMACLAAKIDPQEDIIFENVIPVEDEATIGQWVMDEYQGYQVFALIYNKQELSQIVEDFEAGNWP